MKKDKAESEESIYTGLVIDNIEYQTLITKKYSNRKAYTAINPRLLTAFIPGTMTDVFVVAGQEVKAGECLAILEAMKMLNEIKSPFDTKVKEVNVQKGDRVTKNHVLIELE
jgi:biotin carboxyl carrier protein